MRKTSKKNKKFDVSNVASFVAILVIAASFVIFGLITICEQKLSVSGSRLRGMAWEAEGFPAVILGFFTIYIGLIILYYTFRE